MPEGHVIHRLARRLNQEFRPAALRISSPQGRFAAEAALIDRTPLVHAEAVGKHLFCHFEAGIVYIHLGLIGSMRFEPLDDVWGQIRLRLEAEGIAANLRGPQACRLLGPAEYATIVDNAGQDPLRSDASPELIRDTVMRSRRSVGSLLMDQALYAGVGNIYRAETLFRLGISPFRAGRDLTTEEFDAVWEDLVELMRIGVERGRIDTVRDEHLPEVMGREPRKDDHGGEVYVYRREGLECYVCGGVIARSDMQGRNLFYCPRCQSS